MAPTPQLRVLFFDVFGTTVAQRKPVADELWVAAKDALESDELNISDEVRAKATAMTYEDWFDFGGEWNRAEDAIVSAEKAERCNVDWRAVDKHWLTSLYQLLVDRGLISLSESSPALYSEQLQVNDGSLWSAPQLHHLSLIWHRLAPWPDTHRGLTLLNKRFATATLSNTYNELLEELIAYSNLPFTHLYSADMFRSFKPSPQVYLGAAEKLGVKPEECGMVAAHLGDLKGAKACGFYPIYVQRPLEEKALELRDEGIPEMVIREDEEGFVALAERLGIPVD